MANRETWLESIVEQLRPLFARHKAALPPAVRVTCGWTGKGKRAKAIGECWSGATAADNLPHIYISPVVSDSVEVAAIVAHELVHVVTSGDGHGKEFGRVARRIGLEGRLTSTHAGEDLAARLRAMIDGTGLGEYPHGRVTSSRGPTKTQTTRMLKLTCPEDGYTVRTTQKWLEVGYPVCPCGADLLPE